MLTNRKLLLTLSLVVAAGLLAASPSRAADGVVVETNELVMLCQDNLETCALPGEGYEDFVIDGERATFRLTGYELPAGSKRLLGRGVRRVSWEPGEGGTAVTVDFDRAPEFNLINAVTGTELRPGTPQVIAGFGFAPREEDRKSYPVMGSRQPGEHVEVDQHGTYQLPELPPVKYSDALVTLNVQNVDFRDVLWLMSEIGGVSMVLDPYWADEPTGNRRPVGGGADPGSGGSGGGGDPGFRPAGGFVPTVPRSGTGLLTMNLNEVPFDTALELVLMSVGLVKVDIYPGSFDQ